MNPPVAVADPCINICRMDAERKHCQGCGRTLLEISRWPRMTDAERAEVLAQLPARLAWRRGKIAERDACEAAFGR